MPPFYNDSDYNPKLSPDNLYSFRLGEQERCQTVSAISTAISAVDADAKVTLDGDEARIQFSRDLEIVRVDFENMNRVVEGSSCGFRILGTTTCVNGTGVAIAATPGKKRLSIFEQTGTQIITGPDQLAFTSDRSRQAAPKFSIPGTVWGVKTDCYGAYSLVPKTDEESDILMTDGPQDDGKTLKRPLSEDTDVPSTVRDKRRRED